MKSFALPCLLLTLLGGCVNKQSSAHPHHEEQAPLEYERTGHNEQPMLETPYEELDMPDYKELIDEPINS